MRNVWTIANRELKSYFTSPIAYILLAMFGLIFGYFSFSAIAIFVDYASRGQMGQQMPPMNVDQFIIQPTLGNFTIILLFLSPMITMRLFAEETRSGTIELLLTSPVRDFEIIFGKWLAAMLLFACMLAVSMLNLVVVFVLSTPDWRALLVGYLGLLLMGGTFLALGAFISSLTKNQIVAGALTFGLFLMLWVLDWVNAYSTSTVGKVCQYLAIEPHVVQFSKGVIEFKDMVYYVSSI
jgi:ABC-2 type transport system permease protein